MASERITAQFNLVVAKPEDLGIAFRNLFEAQAASAAELIEMKNRVCGICNKMFASSGNRIKHIKRMHKELNNATENDSISESGENNATNLDTSNDVQQAHEMVNEVDTSSNAGRSANAKHGINSAAVQQSEFGFLLLRFVNLTFIRFFF